MSPYWEANLEALRARGGTAAALAGHLTSGPAPDLGLRRRDGRVLAGIEGDRPRALVSAYDAVKEADRWAADLIEGTVAVFGAAGTELAKVLAERGAHLVFWVEPRLEVWRSLLTWEDWTIWIADEAWIPVFDLAAWRGLMRDRYHPLWDGAFSARDWRAATQGDESLWDPYRQTAREALDSVSSDASTQARFGERWYRNMLVNLERLKPASVPACSGARVVIAGAGPGLDDALERPENLDWLAARTETGDRLFSTDTAFPALVARGIVPDLVFCLDGQLPSYHHFVPKHPAVPLVADLASLPLFGRLGLPVVRYLSGHPFGRVIRRWFPELPRLDGSLGNVSGLALMTARGLGASRVDAWGADFCYRDGQSYARSTYVYDLAGLRVDRLHPWETRLGASCYGARGLERTFDAHGRALDTTPLLRDYRERWLRAPSPSPVALAHEGAAGRWQAFAADWRRRLEALPLPPPGRSTHAFFLALTAEEREDWLALWPLALSLQRQGADQAELPRLAIERARALV